MTKARKLITAGAVGIALVAGATWIYRRADATEAPAYRFAAIERGNLRASVSASGKLGAERTVQVGTQVSGQIAALLVDFNDRVTKGQLLARIDPVLQQAAVQDAQAQLERAQAQLVQARAEFERNKPLFEAKYVTASEFGVVQSNYAVAQSAVKSAQISLQRARQNLSYTNIYSPIDGIIVERNVDVGQTVAASLSAPQLFLIANDLSEMEILASVDESDIGSIEEGQKATFTVQSFPNRTFEGSVKQVRLQSTTQDNVVNYTVVIGVPNREGRLLPGMTATVDFVTGEATNVLSVPNAALRIRATPEMRAEAGLPAQAGGDSAARAARRNGAGGENGANGGATGAGAGAAGAQGAGFAARQGGTPTTPRTDGAPVAGGAASAAGGMRGRPALLWYVKDDGKLGALRVRTGVSDGSRTEVSGEGLTEGMDVIVGITAPAAEAGAAGGNPLSPTRPQQGGPPRGF